MTKHRKITLSLFLAVGTTFFIYFLSHSIWDNQFGNREERTMQLITDLEKDIKRLKFERNQQVYHQKELLHQWQQAKIAYDQNIKDLEQQIEKLIGEQINSIDSVHNFDPTRDGLVDDAKKKKEEYVFTESKESKINRLEDRESKHTIREIHDAAQLQLALKHQKNKAARLEKALATKEQDWVTTQKILNQFIEEKKEQQHKESFFLNVLQQKNLLLQEALALEKTKYKEAKVQWVQALFEAQKCQGSIDFIRDELIKIQTDHQALQKEFQKKQAAIEIFERQKKALSNKIKQLEESNRHHEKNYQLLLNAQKKGVPQFTILKKELEAIIKSKNLISTQLAALQDSKLLLIQRNKILSQKLADLDEKYQEKIDQYERLLTKWNSIEEGNKKVDLMKIIQTKESEAYQSQIEKLQHQNAELKAWINKIKEDKEHLKSSAELVNKANCKLKK